MALWSQGLAEGALQGPAEGGEQGAMQGPAEGSSKGFEQEMVYSIMKTVSEQIGSIAKPDKIVIVSGLPKTRSGKIMRRILRKIAEGEFDAIGDTTTLLDPSVVQEIIDKAK